MKKKTIVSRRSMLRGLGGVAVGLPVLEIMGSRSRAQVSSDAKRFAISFTAAPTTTGNSFDDMLTPDATGPGYEIRRALAPIESMGLRDEAMLVSGLKIPWGNDPSSIPGARDANYSPHYRTWQPQVAGTHTAESQMRVLGSTADNIVADAIGGSTPHDVLRYSLRGKELSYRVTDSRASPQGSITSARFAYENLFADGITTDANAEEQARAALLLRRRRSVLDLVQDNTQRLSRRLGRADSQRLDQHFSFIRDLETRLDALEMPTTDRCVLPDDPGADGSESQVIERADIFMRMMAMGFACDLSRSGSFMQSEYKCYMPINWVTDLHGSEDMHTYSHNSNQEAVSDSIAFFVSNMCKLASYLREIPSVDGANMLDHSALVMLFECGRGYDPDGDRDRSAHATENMVALVFGGAGGLKRGHHIQTDEAHPAQVVLTAMQAVGVETNRLGELEGALSQLRA